LQAPFDEGDVFSRRVLYEVVGLDVLPGGAAYSLAQAGVAGQSQQMG
jgi:hypothetical protein